MYYLLYSPYPYLWIAPFRNVPTQAIENLYSHIPFRPQNQFPSINTKMLNTSAKRFNEVMKQANLLINKITNSPTFAYKLMEAAQLSNKKKVKELITSAGITIKFKTKFNPSGISIELSNSETEDGCCNLHIALPW